MSSEQIEGKWRQLACSFREKFGQFTNKDMAGLSGKRDQLIVKLQEQYGNTHEEAERQFDEWSADAGYDTKRQARAAGSS